MQINLRIILQKPNAAIDFGIQEGSGNTYTTILKQRSIGKDLVFEFAIAIKNDKNGKAVFWGPIVQGPADGKFIYIDIGVCAGQFGAAWQRRLKIPLYTITQETISTLLSQNNAVLETKVMGTGKDGGPNCGTVKPFEGWHVVKK